jgi:hypothetical protein
VPVAAALTTPLVDETGVTLRLPDENHRLAAVRLYQRVGVPDDQLDFAYRRGAWSLRTTRTEIDRLEYLLEIEHLHGGRETITDPTNPLQVPGAFGAKSVIEFPGYRRPDWLELDGVEGSTSELSVPSTTLGATIRGLLWSPDQLAADVPAPLIVVHDGPEYASLAGIGQYAAALIGTGQLPALRLALLAPGDRNRWYAAMPAGSGSAPVSVGWPCCTRTGRPRTHSTGCSCNRAASSRPTWTSRSAGSRVSVRSPGSAPNSLNRLPRPGRYRSG